MAGRIPQSFIDDLISRADIVEVINSRVPLKKKGREYQACCPFHNEKTPSFTVSEAKQFYHCFGCGAHGTAIGFLMEYEHLDFVDAIETLAAEYHLEVPREDSPWTKDTRDEKRELYDVLESASQLYQSQLRQSDKAINYLKQRGLSGEIAKRYRLGYAPNEWRYLIDNINNITALEKSGMTISKSADKQYDRFRDRIMFPILDRRGHTIAFGGRIIDDGEPKYLNSPETEVFHKGYELYGFYEARQAVRKLTRIIVVEGYMDVVALAQSGIEYAVASLGTATTKDQIQKLFRSVSQIVFCYDGDNAGRKAAWRALENTLPIIRDGLEASFLFLPEGEDPDSLVRKEGKDAFEQRLDKAMPLSEFLFNSLTTDINLDTMEGKARLENKAKPLLGKIPESIFKDLMYQRLSELIGISTDKLTGETAGPEQTIKPAAPEPRRSTRQIKQNATRDAIALLLQHPELVSAYPIPESFRDASLQGFPLLYQLYDTIQNNTNLSSSALLERYRDNKEFEILQKLLQRDVQGTDDRRTQEAVYKDAVQQLVNKYKDERYEILDAKVRESGLSDEEMDEYKTLLQR